MVNYLGSLLRVEKSTVCHAMGELRKAGYVDIIKTRYENGTLEDDIIVMTERAIAQINLLSTQFDNNDCGRIIMLEQLRKRPPTP